MKQLRKRSNFTFFLPTRALAAAWYRITAINTEPTTQIPENVLERLAPKDDNFRHLSFTFSVIALSARVATASGELTRDKYVAFRDAFPLIGGLCGKLRKLFVLACTNTAPYEHYVNQIKHIFPRQMDLFYSLVERLFAIAAADGNISREEERILSRIAHLLGLGAGEYSEIRDRFIKPPKPHQVLGVDKREKAAKLKKHYYSLMQQYHPDRYASEKLSPEVDALLHLKVSEINEAYDLLSKKAA